MRVVALCFLLLTVCSLAGCADIAEARRRADALQVQTLTVPVAPDVAFRTAAQFAAERGWTIRSSDISTGILQIETDRLDELSVTVAADPAGARIRTRHVAEFRPNREDVRDYLKDIETAIGGSAPPSETPPGTRI